MLVTDRGGQGKQKTVGKGGNFLSAYGTKALQRGNKCGRVAVAPPAGVRWLHSVEPRPRAESPRFSAFVCKRPEEPLSSFGLGRRRFARRQGEDAMPDRPDGYRPIPVALPPGGVFVFESHHRPGFHMTVERHDF